MRVMSPGSAVLNAFAFYEGVGTGYLPEGAAIGFGLGTLRWINVPTWVGAALYLHGDR